MTHQSKRKFFSLISKIDLKLLLSTSLKSFMSGKLQSNPKLYFHPALAILIKFQSRIRNKDLTLSLEISSFSLKNPLINSKKLSPVQLRGDLFTEFLP